MPGTNPFSKFSDGTNEYEVKDAVARQDLSTHTSGNITTSQGMHGIRYYEGALAYKDGEGNFQEIQTGAGVVELTQQQYDNMSAADKNKDIIYVITDSDIVPADNSRIVNLENTVGPVNKTTTFNANGSITEMNPGGTVTTTFNSDGSITEVYAYSDGTTKTKTTSFSGSNISETVVNS